MKLIALLFPLVANGAVIKMVERQTPESGGGPGALASSGVGAGLAAALLPKKRAMKIEEIPAKVPGAKRIRMLYGPYKLKAANGTAKVGNGFSMDKGGTSYQYMVDDDFPRDVTVLETTSHVQDENFKRADTKDGLYNHHNVFMDFATPPAPAFGCDNGKKPLAIPMSVFMAGATEVGDSTFAAAPGTSMKSGYYLSKDRKMLNMIDVINYNNIERTVYVQGEIEFLPGKQDGYLESRQERVDPGMCGGQNGAFIHAPKGQTKFSVNASNIVAARDGWIVNSRGHVHDGGLDVVLKINGRDACTSKATYGGEGHVAKTADGKTWETIATTSLCLEPVKVSKGDRIFMEAHYDLGLHPSREQGGHGGMKRWVNAFAGGGEAEQMAMMITNFAYAD